MKIIGLDNKSYNWKPKSKKRKNPSKLHSLAKDLISTIYPSDPVLEEVTLPGTKRLGRSSLLYADFYLPNRKLIIEVHGEQHYKYNIFFYKNKYSYYQAQARDRDKKEWCEINDINLIELAYDVKIDDWTEKLLNGK